MFITANSSPLGQPGVPTTVISTGAGAGSAVELGIAAAGGFTGQSTGPGFESPSPVLIEPESDVATPLLAGERLEAEPGQLPATAKLNFKPSVRLDGATSAGSLHADQLALAHAEWLNRVGAWIGDWLTAETDHTRFVRSRAAATDPRSALASRTELAESGVAGELERQHARASYQRELAILAGAFTVGATVFQLRKPLKTWWRQEQNRLSTPRIRSRALPRPHQNIARNTKAIGRLKNEHV